MIPALAYWQAVAQGIDAEDQKLQVFVKHNLSLGIAREAILRDLVVHQTPEPYRVVTGFICNFVGTEAWLSRQCDVLVYDPQEAKPYYSIDEFSVVQRQSARLVVEVKTELDLKTLPQIAEVAASARSVAVPVLGFAFEGWTFDKAIRELAEVVRSAPALAPDCIAVHRRNYVIFRHRVYNEGATTYTAFDFGPLGERGEGLATAMLLDLCHHWVRPTPAPWTPPRFFETLKGTGIIGGKISPDGTPGPYSFD